jgi:hypothetical protein
MELAAFARRCAEALGLDPSALRELGGASGSSWAVGDRVLRVARHVGDETAALLVAAGELPVPRVLGHVELDDCEGVLLERLPGLPAGELASSRPERAAAAGRACGALHARLAEVAAPGGLRRVGPDALQLDQFTRDATPRLLHLDLHPFNVLVDEAGAVTGVIDWANAAAGPAVLDRARTWAILALDPTAVALDSRPGWRALVEAWIEAGELDDLPHAARAWASEFMLRDLAARHPAGALAPVRQALGEARAR